MLALHLGMYTVKSFQRNLLNIPYLPSPKDVVKRMLSIADLREGQIFIDLGCGDGRLLVEAAKSYGCKVIGVEKNINLLTYCYKNLLENNIKNFKLVHGDLFKFDVRCADVIALYLTSDALRRLKDNFEYMLKPNAKIISHDFSIPGWRPLDVEQIRSIEDGRIHYVYIYEAGRSFKVKQGNLLKKELC